MLYKFESVPLTLNLTPKTCQYSNLKSQFSKDDWNKLRKNVYYHSEYRCEICGGIGNQWPVECHEKWEYDDRSKIQILKGFYCLCPLCHLAKHLGLAYYLKVDYKRVLEHIRNINHFSQQDLMDFIRYEWNKQRFRENCEWKLNIDILRGIEIDITRILLIDS